MTNHRIVKLMAITVAALCLSLGILAQPASAALVTSSGTTGYVGLPTGICRHYTNWNRLDVQVYPPQIYAPNINAGWGNDAAWVRYQLQVVDRYGRVVQTSTASGWAAAYDNQPASFANSATFQNIPEYSTVRVHVEWVGVRYGYAQHRLDKYVLYSGGSGPYAAPGSCSRWTV